MQHSPSWKSNRFSASQKIPRILCNPKVHYAFTSAHHLSLFWASSIQSIPPHPTSWRSILILSSNLRLGLQGSFVVPHQNPVYASPLPHTRYMPRPPHSSRFYHANNIGRGVKIIKLLLSSFLHSPVTSFLLGPNIVLNTPASNTLSLGSFLNVSDHVSHLYKTTGKIIVL